MEGPLCPPTDPGFRLIETFGYVPGQGCRHLRLHLARMARSARDMGLAFDRSRALGMTQSIQSKTELRCRMTLDVKGKIELTTAQMPSSVGVWRVGIAEERLHSTDPWLQHKTTRRALYDTARANLPEGVDELIFLNERDEVCEGTITNIFVRSFQGEHSTPPLSCGLLPGVLRQSLLDQGRYAECVLHVDDLRRARYIGVGNSLRGLCAAELIWPLHSAAFKSAGPVRE